MADAVHHAVLTAAVYYAGHGVSVENENDLLPTGLVLRPASDLEIHGLSVSSILRQMKREERANVVMPIPPMAGPVAAPMSGWAMSGNFLAVSRVA